MDTISIGKITKGNNSAKNAGGATVVITKGNNSTKNAGGATVVNLCTSSGHALYLCQVS